MAVKSVELKDLCVQIVDCPHSTPVWTESGEIVLRSNNIRNGRLDISTPSFTDTLHFDQRTKRAAPRGGDLVITREAPMGEVCLIPDGLRCCLGQRMVLLRPDAAKVDSRYLLYALQSREVQHEIHVNEGTGSTVSNLRIPLLEVLKIPWRPLPEQRRIAHILGTLDDKIELNRRMNETLEEMARALFKSWFVDFDPVRAKAEGRGTRLPKHLADLFPNRLVDSEIGEIPEGWEAVPLSTAIEVNPQRRLSKGTEASYLDMASMPTAGHAPREAVIRAVGSGAKFMNGDTLLARITPCLENGKTAYVDFLDDGEVGWGSTEYIVLRPKEPLPSHFAYYLARTDVFREFAIQSMVGSSGRQRVPASALDHYLVALPNPEVTRAFGDFVSAEFARIRSGANEITCLVEMRDALLTSLLRPNSQVDANWGTR